MPSEPKMMRQDGLGGQHFDRADAQFAFRHLSRMDVAHIGIVAVLLLIALHRTRHFVGDGAPWIIVKPQQTFLDHRSPPYERQVGNLSYARSKRSMCQVLRLASWYNSNVPSAQRTRKQWRSTSHTHRRETVQHRSTAWTS